MEKTLIVALHGFLGGPEDWSGWYRHYGLGRKLDAVALWFDPYLNSTLSLAEWTKGFMARIREEKAKGFAIELWGYSMGGRLALGALLEDPELFSKGVIISANPGLEDSKERQQRLERDEHWAEKFRHQDWTSLMREWHQQPVFFELEAVDNSVKRQEKDFDRERLALALSQWSVALQPNYWPRLESLPPNVEWHVGSLDKTYLEIGQRVLTHNPGVILKIHSNRGHRLLMNPNETVRHHDPGSS